MEKITKFYKQIYNLSFGICAATVKTIIRQNKKDALLEFLFGSTYGRGEVSMILDTSSSPGVKILEDQIEKLQNQVDSLQQKIIQLEKNQTLNFKKGLSELLKPSQAFKIHQQGDSTLKPNKGSYFQENHHGTHSEIREVPKLHSNVLS